jgi:hypothetical protein
VGSEIPRPAYCTYVTRRRAEGKSSLEIIRALKRYVAREVYPLLGNNHLTT